MKLKIENLQVHFNKLVALKGISFSLDEGDFITLIGSNGAGKSTTLRTISGLHKPSSGEIYYGNQRIDHLSSDKILRLGIAHTPEGRRIFTDLNVIENLYLGAFIYNDDKQIKQDLDKIFGYFPRLDERKQQLAATLSGGEQQMLSIGRALMSRPKTLMLDEPSLGLSPLIVQEIAKILIDINKKQGVSIILVEQNAELALEISKYAYVLEHGKITLSGKSEDLLNDSQVQAAYLGG